jgi:hypothetical protein
MNIQEKAQALLNEAIEKAWDNLRRGKFSNFGYWAAKTVQFRELLGKSHEPSPFGSLVKFAKENRGKKDEREQITLEVES